jgi:hypothetical protein
MLSRVAESLYWMARYLERAENTARLINSTTQTCPRPAAGRLVRLGRPAAQVAGLDNFYSEHYGQANEDDIMRFLIADERNPSSIVSCIHSARENTRTFREVLPMEIWERINSLYLYPAPGPPGAPGPGQALRGAQRHHRAAPVGHRPADRFHEPGPGLPVHQAGPQHRARRHDHAHRRRQFGGAPAGRCPGRPKPCASASG